LQTPLEGARVPKTNNLVRWALRAPERRKTVHHEGLKNNIQSTVKSTADTKKGNPHASDALQEANGTQT
jgi:hypothetical protein